MHLPAERISPYNSTFPKNAVIDFLKIWFFAVHNGGAVLHFSYHKGSFAGYMKNQYLRLYFCTDKKAIYKYVYERSSQGIFNQCTARICYAARGCSL